ncbi:MAG: hypothetical protein IPH31_04210 [Lewinellaceae bacterium]|nr:hypothetical protein [Lewinellaceae bacterium]
MRRKFLCILLLTCLTAPVLVSYGWLHYQKTLVRKQVKRQLIAGLGDDALVLLRFTVSESQTKLRWEHAREFEYQGQMYDVVRTETNGDTIFFHCWWDREETELNREIKKLTASNFEKNPGNQKTKERLAHFFKSLYSFEGTNWPIIVLLIEAKQEIPGALFSLKPILSPPPSPPPEIG